MSARIGAAEVHAVMHLVGATSSLQRVHALLDHARMDLGEVTGADAYEVWSELHGLLNRVEAVRLRVKALALSPDVQLSPSHTGVNCEHCILANHVGAPESHGDRRSGGAS